LRSQTILGLLLLIRQRMSESPLDDASGRQYIHVISTDTLVE
jgi:hypothetical protein